MTGVPPFGSTRTVTVSLSQDGQNFEDVGNHVFQQNQEEKRAFTFPPTRARYVRLTYSDYYPQSVGYPPTFIFVTGLQAYGKAG